MGDPPSEAGADQETVIALGAAVGVGEVGASGAPIGVEEFEEDDTSLVPATVRAVTVVV